jgi:hypothetical protein
LAIESFGRCCLPISIVSNEPTEYCTPGRESWRHGQLPKSHTNDITYAQTKTTTSSIYSRFSLLFSMSFPDKCPHAISSTWVKAFNGSQKILTCLSLPKIIGSQYDPRKRVCGYSNCIWHWSVRSEAQYPDGQYPIDFLKRRKGKFMLATRTCENIQRHLT